MDNKINSNEREFQSQVFIWLSEVIKTGGTPFEMVSGEAGVTISNEQRKKTRFPDVQLWINRAGSQGFCWWELKTPEVRADDTQLLKDALEKARARNHKYFVTWNMREAILWKVPEGNQEISNEHRIKNYSSASIICSVNDITDVSKREVLKKRAQEILYDLTRLYQDGHIYQIETDATFFVHKLSEAVKKIYHPVYKALQIRVGKDAKFRDKLNSWAILQGIPNFGDEPFYQSVARQMVYRIIGKILFYVTLRRFYDNLPIMNFTGLPTDKVSEELKNYFMKARQVDYQSIFKEDLIDEIEYPQDAADILTQLVQDLNHYNFSSMPQDVIGKVYENLIPHEERHLLGQYFTPENLVDLINAFCIRTNSAQVLDPTCGTGTFLIRAYNKKHTEGERDHHTLLSQLWGFDIAQFPSELATINLFRQNLQMYANFPHIVTEDFFKIKPGQTFEFPPPKPDLQNSELKIQEKLPKFDAIVGNFPYIRQELIEKTVKGYKNQLDRVLAEDWLKNYPQGFDKNQTSKLSGQADIFAYLFYHSGVFLKEGGRMGIVTSNSYLDVAYGYELQKFFLSNFKIIAVIESRCEPWFEDVAVNTVVTILERCSNNSDRENNLVKFIKLKKKLSELIPWDMKLDFQKRWQGLNLLAHKIEHSGDEYSVIKDGKIASNLKGLKTIGDEKDDDFRIRIKTQSELLEEVNRAGKTVKWGQYLRAPEVYFELLKNCKDKLTLLTKMANLRYGIKTGINEFFYLDKEKIKHWNIESRFLLPILKSYREIDTLVVNKKNLKTMLFSCNLSKSELKKKSFNGALKYIEHGEKQLTEERGRYKKGGIAFPEVASVKGRKYWYGIEDIEKSNFVINVFVSERFGFPSNNIAITDHTMFEGIFKKQTNTLFYQAFLNSTITYLFTELCGRANLGEGVLTVYGPDIEEIFLPDITKIGKAKAEKIISEYKKLEIRSIKPIFEEVKMKDRQKFDGLVLEAIGLDPKIYLPKIYDGLCELVKERLELAKMRKAVQKVKMTRDVEKLKKSVIEKVLPNELRKFPESFLPDNLKTSDFKEINVPEEPLKLGHQMMIFYEVFTDSGFKYNASGVEEARYLVFAQKPNQFVIKIPKNQIVVQKIVIEYEKYLKKLLEELFKELFERTGDHFLSDQLAKSILIEFDAQVDIL